MRDDSVGKGINLLGVIIGALLLVGVLIAIVYFVISKVNSAKDDIGKTTDTALNFKYEQYAGETVTGSEVLACISKFKSDTIYICVNNGLTTTYYNLDANLQPNGENVSLAKDKKDLNHYINPSSNYEGEVNYLNDDPTDVILGITFTKQ